MTNHRPLREITVRALYALHMGIVRQPGLINNALFTEEGVCAIGALSHSMVFSGEFNTLLDELGLQDDSAHYVDMGSFAVEELNDGFEGTPKERREFMLRHIVSELHIRQLSLPEENTAGTPRQPREKKEEVKAYG